MKIIQTVPNMSRNAAGPSYSVPGLCEALGRLGEYVELHLLGDYPQATRSYKVQSYQYGQGVYAWALGRSPGMLAGLRGTCQTAEIIQNNSLWMMPNIYPAWARKGTNCKLVTAPRGTLAAWSLKRSYWKKKLIGWYGQYAALRETDLFYATCEKEYEEIRAFGLKQPVAIIPIGMDIPAVPHHHEGQFRKLLFFGRIHEVKAVDNLVLAWATVADKFPGWELVIAGPDCGAKPKLDEIIAARHVPRVRFIGEFKGAAKYDLLASADLYVLPSKTENFAITVAEALASGTPVIASQGTPWSGLVPNKCGWWVPIGAEPLAAQLVQSLALPPAELESMGENGRRWIARDFTWESVAKKSLAAYEWLCHGGDKPGWVRLD